MKNTSEVLKSFISYLDGNSNDLVKKEKGDQSYRRIVIGVSNNINIQYNLINKIQFPENEVDTLVFEPYKNN